LKVNSELCATRPGLARRGPPGDIIARGRPSFAAQSNFPHKPNVKFLGGPPGWCPPRPYGQSGPVCNQRLFRFLAAPDSAEQSAEPATTHRTLEAEQWQSGDPTQTRSILLLPRKQVRGYDRETATAFINKTLNRRRSVKNSILVFYIPVI
jgi:hypothetical protein